MGPGFLISRIRCTGICDGEGPGDVYNKNMHQPAETDPLPEFRE